MHGLWVISKNNKDSYFVSDASGTKYDKTLRSIFNSSETITIFGSDYNAGATEKLQNYPQANGSQYWYLFKPANAQTIKLKHIKLNVGLESSFAQSGYEDFSFDVVVRYYDFSKRFYGIIAMRDEQPSDTKNTLYLYKTQNIPSVGDRIEIVEKTYSTTGAVASCPRNISSITTGDDYYTVVLDEDLPENIGTTTYNTCSIIPLKKAGKISITSDINMQDLKFDIPDQPEGKKFIFEIEIRNNADNIRYLPELNYMEIYYDIID